MKKFILKNGCNSLISIYNIFNWKIRKKLNNKYY